MSEPFSFIVDLLSDELAEVSVAVVDPLTRVDTWLNEDERFFKEVEVFSEWTERFLQQYFTL